jgi:hypothetical protein
VSANQLVLRPTLTIASMNSYASFSKILSPQALSRSLGRIGMKLWGGIGRHLHNESLALQTIYDRLSAIENQTKKRSSRGFIRYLLAICVGAAATLAWLSYGDAAKQIVATRGPELGWSPETKQMIVNWMQQFGWTKPGNGPEKIAVSVPEAQLTTVAQTAPAAVTPATPSIDREQVHQIAVDLAALEQTVDQLAASQDKIGHNIDRLQGAVAEILVKIPEPPPSPIAAAPAVTGRPVSGGAPHSENTQNTSKSPTSQAKTLKKG